MRAGFGKNQHLAATVAAQGQGISGIASEVGKGRPASRAGGHLYVNEDEQLIAAVAAHVRIISGVDPAIATKPSTPQANRAEVVSYGKDDLLLTLFAMGRFHPETDAPAAEHGFIAASYAAVTRMHREGKLASNANYPSMQEFGLMRPEEQRRRIYSLIKTYHQ